MKKRIFAIVLAALLFLTGCAPATQSAEPWDRNLGTTTSNILMSGGKYAIANGFVYIDRGHSIVEYDLETKATVIMPMQGPDNELHLSSAASAGTVFLLEDGIAFKQRRTRRETIRKPGEKAVTELHSLKAIALMAPDGQETTVFEEFGSEINYFTPVKKQLPSDYEPDPANPLAGLDFYYSAIYDTWPEVAAEMEQVGLTPVEPDDPVERSRYYSPALFHYDGDTGESTIIERLFMSFYVDDEYIYITRDVQGNGELFRSNRQEIDFELVDVGSVGNKLCSYNGTLGYTSNSHVCLYDGETVRELPIQSGNFLLSRNKVVFEPFVGPGLMPDVTVLHIYDIDTGTTEVLSTNAHYQFAVLEDRYVAYREVTNEHETDILYDLETGERIEMYRTEVG